MRSWLISKLGEDNGHITDTIAEVKTQDEANIIDSKDDEFDLGEKVRKVKFKKGSAEEASFDQSRKDELQVLLLDRTFIPFHIFTIPATSRIFNPRFVDELEKVGEHLRKKSSLVAQNYADADANIIQTKASTVQRFSQRISMSLRINAINEVLHS